MSKPILPVLPESLLARKPRLSGICPPFAIILLFLVGPLISFGLGNVAHTVGPIAGMPAVGLYVGLKEFASGGVGIWLALRPLFGPIGSTVIPIAILLIEFLVYPALLGAIVGGIVHLVCNASHCRNVSIASWAGALNGAIAYAAHAWRAWDTFGGFHPFIIEPDQLPAAVRVFEYATAPIEAVLRATITGTTGWMYVIAIAEFLLVLIVGVFYSGGSIAQSNYCETHRCWYGNWKQAKVRIGSAEAIAAALQTGDTRGIAAIAPLEEGIYPYLLIKTRSCPKGPSCEVQIACEVYWQETAVDEKGNTRTSVKPADYFDIMMPASFGYSLKRALKLPEELRADAAQAATAAHVIAADAMKTELVEAGAVCWFCQKDKPADGKPHHVVVFKKEGDERTDETIWVPRCSICEAVHQRQSSLSNTVQPVALLAIIGLCILIGVLGAKPLGFWAWVIGVVVALIGFGAVVMIVENIIRRRADTAGTRIEELAKSEYPGIQELIKQGWLIDSTKTGTAKS